MLLLCYEIYSVTFLEYGASLGINDNDLQKEPAFSVVSPILFQLQLTETLSLLKSTQRIKTWHEAEGRTAAGSPRAELPSGVSDVVFSLSPPPSLFHSTYVPDYSLCLSVSLSLSRLAFSISLSGFMLKVA